MKPNNPITIGIDIDDTLALSAPMFINYSNNKWGTSLKVSDYTEDWASLWGVDYDEVTRRADEYLQSGIMLDYKTLPGTHEVLKNLNNKYRLISVSARNDACRSDTILWIQKHYGDILSDNDLHFIGAWNKITEYSVHHTKEQICKELGIDILIDDQLKHCLGASNAGIRAILFGDYSWNRSDSLPDNVIRAKDWFEVQKIIDRIYG